MKFNKKIKLTTKPIDFYSANIYSQDFKGLEKLVDNGTTVITIQTPKGWKCKRKNCSTSFKHTHSTYSVLNEKKTKN